MRKSELSEPNLSSTSTFLSTLEAKVAITREALRRAPKVILHDHLDGGLRPETIIELAAGCGHRLPADDPEKLRAWFAESADSGSLDRYLETFDHTIAVMQTAAALRRVATEMVLDVATDGAVYVESSGRRSST